jgi:hypothetical protein
MVEFVKKYLMSIMDSIRQEFFQNFGLQRLENNSTQVMPTIEITFLKLPMLTIRRKDIFNFLRHTFGGPKNIIRKK